MRMAIAHHHHNHKQWAHMPAPILHNICSPYRNNNPYQKITNTRLSNSRTGCLAHLVTHMIAAALPHHSTATIVGSRTSRRSHINPRSRTTPNHYRTTILGKVRMATKTMTTDTTTAMRMKAIGTPTFTNICMQHPSRPKDTAIGTEMKWTGTRRTRT